MCKAERTLPNFNNKKILICQKFDNAGYLSHLTNSVIRDYEHKQNKRQQQKDEEQEDNNIIPPISFKNYERIYSRGVAILPTEWTRGEMILAEDLSNYQPKFSSNH